jgi:hypothetical protein
MTMEDIIDAALKENWEYVDGRIPQVCQDEEVQKRAYDLLTNKEPNLRDLGASILGKATIPEKRFSNMRDRLRDVMLSDSNIYARYRASFALAANGCGSYKTEVIGVLNKAKDNPDVGEIALEYLKRLK